MRYVVLLFIYIKITLLKGAFNTIITFLGHYYTMMI